MHECKELSNTQESVQRKRWEHVYSCFYFVSGLLTFARPDVAEFQSLICSCPGCQIKDALSININTFNLLSCGCIFTFYKIVLPERESDWERERERAKHFQRSILFLVYLILLPFGRTKNENFSLYSGHLYVPYWSMFERLIWFQWHVLCNIK